MCTRKGTEGSNPSLSAGINQLLATMTERRASCGCGQLNLTCEGEPARVSICHCLACQRRTGSAFGVQARFGRDHVRAVEGRVTQFVRIGDSGGRATFHSCPACGSTVYWELDGLPDFVMVAVGAFADPDFPPPTVAVYEARRHPWTVMPELNVEHLD
jgi:hypothetical protein